MRKPRKVIVACMRNEALFLVEWVAHHLAVGFDRIIIYTNDCDDETATLCDLMSRHFPVEHHDNPGPYDKGSIQKQALFAAMQLPVVRKASWVLHIDADEYVNVSIGNRKIDDLIALHPGADGIALMWRHFGDSGVDRWTGGSVVETFLRCEGKVPVPESGDLVGFKTLFRPQKFKEMGVHTPKMPYRRRVPVIVNAAGAEMPLDAVFRPRGSGYAIINAQSTWDNARLHHHHVKSDDLHLMKLARGDANGRSTAKRVIGSDFYHHSNRNEGRDRSLLRFRAQVRPIEARIRAIPGVVAAEARAFDWFQRCWQDAALPERV